MGRLASWPIWLVVADLITANPVAVPEQTTIANGSFHANYIFNSLHNSMRMFGNVLDHNGMSVMLASVSEGTEFYHGSAKSERISGMQWLAFEPEHAMAFARPKQERRHSNKASRLEYHEAKAKDQGSGTHYREGKDPRVSGHDGHHEGPDHPDDERAMEGLTVQRRQKPKSSEHRISREGNHAEQSNTYHVDVQSHQEEPHQRSSPAADEYLLEDQYSHEDSRKDAPRLFSEAAGERPKSRQELRRDTQQHNRHRSGRAAAASHGDEFRVEYEDNSIGHDLRRSRISHKASQEFTKDHGKKTEKKSKKYHKGLDRNNAIPWWRSSFQRDHAESWKHASVPHAASIDHSDRFTVDSDEHRDHAISWKHASVPHADSPEHAAFDPAVVEEHRDHAESRKHVNVPHAQSTQHPKHEGLSHDYEVDRKPTCADEHSSARRPLSSTISHFFNRFRETATGRHTDNHGANSEPYLSSKFSKTSQSQLAQDDVTDAADEKAYGYLHTYRTRHALTLVYLDGQSAAKSVKGTLDTQDLLLTNASSCDASPFECDRLRGQALCAVAEQKWPGQIAGFLRMVGGFEIILCDFAKDLDVVDIVHKEADRQGHPETNLDHAQALATRYDGIGGERVTIDYSTFLSAYAYPDAVHFPAPANLPRLVNSSAALTPLRAQLDANIHSIPGSSAFNWQAQTDLVVARYAHRIQLALSPSITTYHDFRRLLHLALEPFIDDAARDSALETAKCSAQFLPAEGSVKLESVPAQALRAVTTRLCSSLVDAASAETYEQGKKTLVDLEQWLGWAEFKRSDCSGCAVDEVCQLPIWPTGSEEDFERPRCSDGERRHGAGGYWDLGGRYRG